MYGNKRPRRGYGGVSRPFCEPRSSGGKRRGSGPRSNSTTTGLSSRFPASFRPSCFPQKTMSATSEARIICTELIKKTRGSKLFVSDVISVAVLYNLPSFPTRHAHMLFQFLFLLFHSPTKRHVEKQRNRLNAIRAKKDAGDSQVPAGQGTSELGEQLA